MAVPVGAKVVIRGFHTLLIFGVSFSLLSQKSSYLYSWVFVSPATSWPLAASYAALLLLGLGLYHAACLTEPGYVPLPDRPNYTTSSSSSEDEASDPEVEQMLPEAGGERMIPQTGDRTSSSRQPPSERRKCGYCNIKQPLRARHCTDCGRCVRRYDHHCPWLASCVGERNHALFWAFLAATSLLVVWTMVIAWSSLSSTPRPWLAWLSEHWVSLLDLLICFFSALPVGGLLAFHTYLAVSNQTTWELGARHKISYLKSLPAAHNPFHAGYCKNFVQFMTACVSRRWDKIYSSYQTRRHRQQIV